MADDAHATENGDRAVSLEKGVFGMPRPQGWTIERVVNLMAGRAVLATLSLGRERSRRWRFSPDLPAST
jgi:hypothetical protein